MTELAVAWFAHSHSASQLLRHLPLHWNSSMLPPHCGQTKLMIEEIMLELDSPGSVSTLITVSYLAGAIPGITPDSKPREAQP